MTSPPGAAASLRRSAIRPALVLLVRHALTGVTGRRLPGRAPGLHLSDEGRRQAEQVARRLARLPRVAAIYTSPLERARETAAPIARARDLGLRVERGLSELDVGAWTG
ncbi:MAG: histidine phosphatase family protein, partial [Candidatus Rokuibacteriota bacterium]